MCIRDRFSAGQYRRKNFPCVPFDAHAPQRWTEAERLTDGKSIAVLADLVYSSHALRDLHGQTTFYWRSTSSGCAAGTTMADARLAGILEPVSYTHLVVYKRQAPYVAAAAPLWPPRGRYSDDLA